MRDNSATLPHAAKTDVAPQAPYSPAAVRAVVVSYNSINDLPTCIESLRRSGVEDICIVENGNRQRTQSAVEVGDVAWLGDGTNRGYGAAANLGFSGTDQPLLLLLNPDAVLTSGSVQRLIETMNTTDAALVGPLVIDSNDKVFESARCFPSTIDAAGHALLGRRWPGNPWTKRYHYQARLPLDEPSPVDWLQGSCMLIRRADFERIGGFDDSYFMYVEDTDLCWRLGRDGRKIIFEPRASVLHAGGTSTRTRRTRMQVEHHRSAMRFWWRSRTPLQRLAAPVAAILLSSRLLAIITVTSLKRSLAGLVTAGRAGRTN